VSVADTHPVAGYVNSIYHHVGSHYYFVRRSLRFPGTALYAKKLARERMVRCAIWTKNGQGNHSGSLISF
jgi:hypothetical protein